MRTVSSRPRGRRAGFDELGLRRGLPDRMLPFLVAAMAFLAALAIAGWFGAASLSRHWRDGAGSALTVQVPDPDLPAVNDAGAAGRTRLAAVLAELARTPGVASARALPRDELANLLRPWLGEAAEQPALPLPAVVAVRMAGADADTARARTALSSVAPGTLVEDHGVWVGRLSVLAASLRACAAIAAVMVAAVAAAVIAVAARAGVAARREAIEIVHGLGATDAYIAGRFARRASWLAGLGGLLGATAALPMLLTLAVLAAPFAGGQGQAGQQPMAELALSAGDIARVMPGGLWVMLPALPLCAAAIGYITAYTTVRRWLRRLP